MATAKRTRPRAVVGALRRAAWQLKSALRHSVSAALRTIIFYAFFTIIAVKLFLYVQDWLVMMQLQYELKTKTISIVVVRVFFYCRAKQIHKLLIQQTLNDTI